MNNKNNMKLIMESWRKGQQNLLTEGQALEFIKNGFKKLLPIPKKFEDMVEKAKLEFEEILTAKLEELQQDPDVQAMAEKAAATMESQAPDGERIDAEQKQLYDVGGGQMVPQEALIHYQGQSRDDDVSDDIVPSGEDPESVEDEPIHTRELTRDDLESMGLDAEHIKMLEEKFGIATAESVIEAAEKVTGKEAPPALKDWLVRFLKRSARMTAFGFVDNFIMITAGDYIDPGLKGLLGTSTLFAAGLGNMISDVAGEEAGGSIENVLEKMGVDIQNVSDEQMKAAPGWMKFVDKKAGTFGVAIGCLLGMIPLAFMEDKNKRRTL